jgi:hypothetical protein
MNSPVLKNGLVSEAFQQSRGGLYPKLWTAEFVLVGFVEARVLAIDAARRQTVFRLLLLG